MKIRSGVFETNSSSTHSLVIADLPLGARMETLPLDEWGRVMLKGGEWGWEVADYYDALTKANYMAMYAVGYYPEDRLTNGLTLVQQLEETIIRHTAATGVVFAITRDVHGPVEGYIDHQSIEERQYHHVFEDPEKLRNFIFNPLSLLHTDNDNHD